MSDPITSFDEIRRPPEHYRAWAEGAEIRTLRDEGHNPHAVPPDPELEPQLHEAWMCGYHGRDLPEPCEGGEG